MEKEKKKKVKANEGKKRKERGNDQFLVWPGATF